MTTILTTVIAKSIYAQVLLGNTIDEASFYLVIKSGYSSYDEWNKDDKKMEETEPWGTKGETCLRFERKDDPIAIFLRFQDFNKKCIQIDYRFVDDSKLRKMASFYIQKYGLKNDSSNDLLGKPDDYHYSNYDFVAKGNIYISVEYGRNSVMGLGCSGNACTLSIRQNTKIR